MKPPLIEQWPSLICQGSFDLIEYHLFEKALHSMGQGLLMENDSTEWESALSHWFFLSHTAKRDQFNKSG